MEQRPELRFLTICKSVAVKIAVRTIPSNIGNRTQSVLNFICIIEAIVIRVNLSRIRANNEFDAVVQTILVCIRQGRITPRTKVECQRLSGFKDRRT